MGYIVRIEKSPSSIQSFSPSDSPIFRKKTQLFLYFQDIDKIYGPVSFQHGKMKLKNRRGLPISENFYIQCRTKITQISPEQEYLLMQDLKKINQPQQTPNIIHFSFIGRKLIITISAHYPHFFTHTIQTNINMSKIKTYSLAVKNILNKAVKDESSYNSTLTELRQYGQLLYNQLFHNNFFASFFTLINSTYLSLHIPASLFFIPFEFMFNSEFWSLQFKLARVVSADLPKIHISYQHQNLGLFSFKDKIFEKENQIIQDIFLEKKLSASFYSLNLKTNTAKINKHQWVHFSGHSTIAKKHLFWHHKRQSFDLSDIDFMPQFIFSHACNADFFSDLFYSILVSLFNKNLSAWLGSISDIKIQNSDFAYYFYSLIAKKQNIGQALLNTKKYFFENNAAFWMHYTLIGNSFLRIPYD